MQGLQALEESVQFLELPLALRELCGKNKEVPLPTLAGPQSLSPSFPSFSKDFTWRPGKS